MGFSFASFRILSGSKRQSYRSLCPHNSLFG